MKKTITVLLALCLVFSTFLSANAYRGVLGDYNNDSFTDIKDVNSLLSYLVGLNTNYNPSDFNGDKEINIKDASEILKFLVNLDFECDYNYGYPVVKTGSIPNESTINFVEKKRFNVTQSISYNTTTILHNTNDFKLLFDYTSEEYNDSYFEDKSLFVIVRKHTDYNFSNEILSLRTKDNILYVEEFNNDILFEPLPNNLCIIYEVNKGDIDEVTKIAIKRTNDVNADPFYGEDNITLKVWSPDKATDLVKKQCDDFIAKYPDKNISIQVVPQEESTAGTKMQTDPNKAADVSHFVSDQINDLVAADLLLQVFREPNYVLGISAESIAAENNNNSVKACTVNNKLYGYPSTADNGYVLVYDKRVVSDEDAKTWEGVLKACEKSGKKFMMDASNGYFACMFAFTGGAHIDGFETDGITQKFVNYDENKVINTLTSFATLFHNYGTTFKSASNSDIVMGFYNGNVAAGIDGAWDANAIKDALGENMGVAMLPTITVEGEELQSVGLMGYKFWGVNSTTRFPEAAQLLATHLSNQKCQQQRVKELAWGPSNTKAAASIEALSQPFVKALIAQSEYSVPQTMIQATFWDGFGNMGNKLYGSANKYDKETIAKLWRNTLINVRDEF